MNKFLCTVLGLVLSGFVACGAGAPGPGGSNQQPPATSTESGTCCLNGEFYSCGTKAAFDKCAGFDPGSCHAACGADVNCHISCDDQAQNSQHDPSDCQRNAAKDGSCSSPSGGSCSKQSGLKACTYSSQCSTNNCTDGLCYGNAVGDLCTYSSQCSSNNCTSGCCAGNANGSACNYSSQCSSNNCTGGRCAGNGSGSACNYSSQCNSGNCTGGRCR